MWGLALHRENAWAVVLRLGFKRNGWSCIDCVRPLLNSIDVESRSSSTTQEA